MEDWHLNLPDFLIVGAQKCGTTSLFHYLAADDGVSMPREKEVHFFDQHFDRGLAWYASRFKRPEDGRTVILGEATPLYLFHPLAIGRIRESLPHSRLIIVLRNPVDRAYSHFQHEVALEHERRTFEDAIADEDTLISREYQRVVEDATYFSKDLQRFSYVSRGIYHLQLRRVFDSFPREQVLVLQSERFFADPLPLQKRLHNFLNLTGTPVRTFPHEYSREYPPIADQTRKRLLEYFRPKNEELFELMGERFDW